MLAGWSGSSNWSVQNEPATLTRWAAMPLTFQRTAVPASLPGLLPLQSSRLPIHPHLPSPLPRPAPAVKLNANRHVTGVLRGFDQFMNIVLDNTVDEKLKADLGMVVSRGALPACQPACMSAACLSVVQHPASQPACPPACL